MNTSTQLVNLPVTIRRSSLLNIHRVQKFTTILARIYKPLTAKYSSSLFLSLSLVLTRTSQSKIYKSTLRAISRSIKPIRSRDIARKFATLRAIAVSYTCSLGVYTSIIRTRESVSQRYNSISRRLYRLSRYQQMRGGFLCHVAFPLSRIIACAQRGARL